MSSLLHDCREAWTAEGLAEKTIHGYLTILARAERALGGLGASILSATPSEIRVLAEALPPTRSSRIQLRVALARAWEVARRPDPPLGAVLVPSKPKYGCRAVSEPAAAILAAAAARTPGQAGLAVLLGLYAGLRSNEIASLRWDQLDLDAGWLRVVGKGLVTAELPIHPVLAARLQQAPRAGRREHVFPGGRGRDYVTTATIWNWCRRLAAEAIAEHVAPHQLRHTAIATLHDLTGDLRLAQSFARHASPETTVVYTRVSRRRLERAVHGLDFDAAATEAAL